jgi:GT2 family glycosyltransferase
MLKVSLIATVYNEASHIEKLLNSLREQTRRPDEIIIVDGGSKDGTPDRIQLWVEANPDLPLKLIIEQGANISRGRNLAIAAASHEIIAATDAGVRLLPIWLEKLVQPFYSNPNAISCGFFRADPTADSVFEMAMGATVLPTVRDIKPEKFLPSSRSVAFPRSAWEKIGGYPEWLDYCEDLIFDLNLLKAGYPFVWQPEALVLFRPRSSLKAFYLQYYRYARGDGKADLFLKRHILRYLIYLVFAPLIILLARRWKSFWLVLLFAGEGYVFKPHRRLILGEIQGWQKLTLSQKIQTLLLVPLIRLTGDVAKMLGYPVGLLWRFSNRNKKD